LLRVLSGFVVYLGLLGCIVVPSRADGDDPLQRAGLAVACGLLINLALVLSGLRLIPALVIGVAPAAWGLWLSWRSIRRGARLSRPGAPLLLAGGGAAYLLGAYYVEIVSEPLIHWDARSIWFFHARMIWFDQAVRSATGWTHASVGFSHPDYPKLVPMLAAELATLAGYWNEYLPKGSLVVMLVPVTLWVFSLRREGGRFVLLLAALLFSLDGWLSNGLMDGYVVIYCGLAVVFAARYCAGRRALDLCSALCALGIATSLKNEGLVFAASLLVTVCVLLPRSARLTVRDIATAIATDVRVAACAIVAAAPTVLWTVDKSLWGLRTEYLAGSVLARLRDRAVDGASIGYIFEYLTVRASAIWVPAAILAVATAVCIGRRWPIHVGVRIAAISTGLYMTGLYFTYLSTPWGLDWQLSTSATRLMATATMALLVGVSFLLESFQARRA
jgi:hypothetical protein